MKPIRVLLVDDHAIVRQGIGEILSIDSAIELVGQAGDGSEAIELARWAKPDVVLLDVEMPGIDGEEAILKITDVSPATKIIMLTMHDDPYLVRKFLKLGASAYLIKSVRREDLVAAIRSASYDEDRVVLTLSERTIARLGGSGEFSLTERQLEILLHAAQGKTNQQIARKLHLSPGTVSRHLANIYAKLGVGSRSEATRRALSEGWITVRDVAKSS